MVDSNKVDGNKILYHEDRLKEWKNKGDCAPIYVEIGLTNRCNHRCVFCALDYLERGKKQIDPKIMYNNLKDMSSLGVKAIMFAGEGEPLLHKNWDDFVMRAYEKGIDVSITSNGVLFKKDKAEKTLPYLSWIRFSVDAGSPEAYAYLHGTNKKDFTRVLNNIEDAAKIKQKNNYDVTLGVQALLTIKSLSNLQGLALILKNVGADNLQIKPYSHHPSSKNDLSFDFAEAEKAREKILSFADKDFEIIYRSNTIERLLEEKPYEKCLGLPFFTLIDSSGNLMPCNLYYTKNKFHYGNLNQNLFSEIWKGEKRQESLKMLEELGVNHCRGACRLDSINRTLSDIQKGKIEIKMPEGEKPRHINFI